MDGQAFRAQTTRAALREATGTVHERLHSAPPFLALAQGRLQLSGYAALLSKLGQFYFTVAPSLAIPPSRMALLERDLASVGAARRSVSNWNAPTHVAERLGWQYVVNGSMFGGKLIYRQLDYLLGNDEQGRRFFKGVPGAVTEWHKLCAELEQVGAKPVTRQLMIDSALSAFATFEALLEMEEAVHV